MILSILHFIWMILSICVSPTISLLLTNKYFAHRKANRCFRNNIYMHRDLGKQIFRCREEALGVNAITTAMKATHQTVFVRLPMEVHQIDLLKGGGLKIPKDTPNFYT